MILPVPSVQYPNSLTGRVGRMHHSFPSACLFGGWGTLLPLCELFLDTAASELTVRDISGHHNPRSKRGKKGRKKMQPTSSPQFPASMRVGVVNLTVSASACWEEQLEKPTHLFSASLPPLHLFFLFLFLFPSRAS